jgi:hypothetical protein
VKKDYSILSFTPIYIPKNKPGPLNLGEIFVDFGESYIGFPLGTTETQAEEFCKRFIDPRFNNPNWTIVETLDSPYYISAHWKPELYQSRRKAVGTDFE